MRKRPQIIPRFIVTPPHVLVPQPPSEDFGFGPGIRPLEKPIIPGKTW